MGFLNWFADENTKNRDIAKAGFEKAAASGDSKELKALRVRVAMRCKTGLDMIFRMAMRATENHAEEVMIALASGETPPPEPIADADTCFLSSPTTNGPVVIYIPPEFASKFFELGVNFQKGDIDKEKAIADGQALAEELSNILNLGQSMVQPITPLEFLLSENQEDQESD
jgi:hypothetical protein